MAGRGRAPKPTALRILEGNRGKRAIPKDEPVPRRGVPEPPSELDDVARVEWDRVAPLLDEVRVLTHGDRGILAAYCMAWSQILRTERVLAVDGFTITDRWGEVRLNPLVGVQREAWRNLRLCGAELGLSPASRTRVRVGGERSESEDPAEKYLS